MFARVAQELTDLGYALDQRILKSEHIVVFRGQSAYGPGQIIIEYPDGYPSVHPRVRYNDRLIRHQRLTGLLCVFGFNGINWRADMSALETVLEAEKLINRFRPGEILSDDDLVPEPRVEEYKYEEDYAILIPPPFSTATEELLKRFTKARLRFLKKNRAVLTAFVAKGPEIIADPPFCDWWSRDKGTSVVDVPLKFLSSPPPIPGHDSLELYKFLQNNGLHQSNYSLLAFPDEWGTRLSIRISWLGVRTEQHANRSSWIRAFVFSPDDRVVRTEFSELLVSKKVLIVGCGSLGSGIAVALAQEGIGEIALVDRDRYEPGNALRHQASMKEFGLDKTIALRNRIEEVSPSTTVEALTFNVGCHRKDSFMALLDASDLIVDAAADPLTTHYLNRLCVKFKKTLVVGSVTNGAWSAEVFRYRPGKSGCWMCFRIQHPTSPPGAPDDGKQFAPGCSQPTFVGGASSMMMASGFAARIVIDTLVGSESDGDDYFIMYGYEEGKGWRPSIESYKVPLCAQCAYC